MSSLFTMTLLFAGLSIAGCKSSDPGAPGEPCNFSASMSCTADATCMNGTCNKLCAPAASSSAACNGGACDSYTYTYTGQTVTACKDPSGQGADAPGSGGSGGGSSACSASCQSTCKGNVPEQACYYCQAACLCRCSGDNACATQNAQSACSLGTCGC